MFDLICTGDFTATAVCTGVSILKDTSGQYVVVMTCCYVQVHAYGVDEGGVSLCLSGG